MGQLLDRALAAMGNYGNTQGQAEVLAKEFIDGTQGMDAVVKQQALDQSLGQMRQLYGTEVADTAYKLASPTPQERGFTGAARDFYNYGAGMIDNMQAPFIAATYGPDSQRMAANNAEIARNNADLSEAQRLDDYKAAQNMAQAKARGEYGVSAYLQNFGASPFKATTELASSVLPAAGIALANAGAVALDSTGVFAPIGAAIHAATPAALAAIGAAQSYGGARADLYEKTMAASDADLIANSPQYAQLRNSGMTEQQAKTQIGTNISDHIPEFVGQTLTGALTGGIEGKLMRGLGGGVLSSVLKGQATEGLDEGAQQILSNYAYQNVDPRQALLEDVPLSALQGAILGSAMGGVGGAVNNYNVKNAPQSQVDAALNVQGTAEQQQLGLPSPSVPLQLGYDNPAAGYNTYARNDTPIAMQDLRGQTAIEMGYNPTSYPSKNIYDANTRTGSRDGTILDMQSNEVPVQNAVSNEVIQRIQEAASQAPLTAQQRIENAASGYSNTSPIDTATAYSPRITAQPDYQSVATVSSPAYDYDAEIAKIDNEIENISNPTANLVGKIKALGSINISERSDLLGTRGREAAKLYPALFSKDGQSLHDYIDSGALNDVLPYDLQVNPTDGVPMDTQPAFEYIAEKLKSGDASINMDLEAQAELGNLQRTRDSMIEARNNDVRYVNQQFANNAQNTNNDYAALQSVLPQRDFIPIASQATYSGWNVDAATERLNEVKNLPLTKKQQNALKILTPKYLTELKDVEGIISKWKEQNGRTTARSNDNTIITGLDRSRPKQSNNSGYVDSTSGENQPATGNADTGSVGKPVSGIQFSQADNSNKKNQLDIINKTNPAPNEYSTWVRSTDDILTAQEAFKPAITDGTMYPDFSIDDMNKAIETGKVEVYSSYPIKNGVFVTPSRMNAESYSGDGKIYTKTVSIDDIAWIDEGEGQYAKLNKTEKQSQTDSSPKTGNTVSQIKTTLADALGLQGKLFRERLPMVDVVQSVTDELRAQVGDGQLSVIAWHGTPHTVDKFTTDKIGTGEGAQAYGYGLYFADRRAVAEQYKDALSDGISVEYKGYPTREPSDFSKDKRRPVQKTWDEAYIINKFKDRLNNQQTDDLAIKGIKDEILKEYVQFDRLTHDEIKSILDEITVKKGRLYQVELAPKENEYLLWDKPFSEQSEYVKKSINDYSLLGNKFAQKIQDENLSGQDIQKGFVSDARNRKGTAGKGILNDGAEKEASKTLLYIGIKGIKYLDSSSRSKGEGSYNYVIFSDDDIEIKAQFSRSQLSGAQGFYNPKTKRITLIADNIPVDKELSVFLHEVFHKRGDELLGDKMPQLVSRVTKWKDADVNSIENQIYVAADARAKSSGNYDSEFLAYAIEEAVNRGVKIDPNKIGDNSAEGFMAYVYRVFTTAFKKLVPNYKGKFTADDLVSIAYGAANLELKGNDNAIQKQSTSQNEEVTSQSQKDQDAEIVAQYATEDGAPTEAQIREARQQIRDVEAKYSKELADGSWVNLTPTGKPSELTKGQWVQTRTDNFKKFFGDWENDPANSSKVVNDKTGEPLVVYHGSNADITTFDHKKATDKMGRERALGFGKGKFYLSKFDFTATSYAKARSKKGDGFVGSYFVNIRNPITSDEYSQAYRELTGKEITQSYDTQYTQKQRDANIAKLDKQLKAQGYDGMADGLGQITVYSPNQIKSAVGNVGTFDSANNDIRLSRSDETKAKYEQAKSKGETELNYRQWVQVRTPEFKAWFGDWENDHDNASKVVNEKTGEPLVMYHGAATGFSTFDERKIGDRDPGFFGAGFYFTPNEGEAQDYSDSAADADGADGGEVIPAFLAIQKPFVWDMEEGDGAKATRHALAAMGIARSSIRGNSAALSNSDERRKFAAAMKAAGHDGVIVRDEDGILEVVAFRPNKIKSATDNIGGFSSQNDDIRFSRPVELDEITDFSKTGKVKNEDTLFGSKTLGSIKAKDWAGFEENFLSNRDKIQEALEDNLVPVKRWIQKMPISNNMKQSIVGALYRAPNVRNVILDEIDSSFITPMSELIAKLSKKYEKLSPQEIKRIAGYWMDTVYAPTANANLIAKDRAAYNEAVAGGDAGEIAAADRKLRERIAEVNDTDLGRRKFKHGVAGGYTNAQAAQIRKNFEALMDVKDLQEIASHVYGMLKYKLDLDLKSGKITQDQYNEWSKNKNYVPLTGEPQSDIDDVSDLLVGGSLNVQKDKAMGGRTSSIAEDAIDAATRAVNKSAVFAGYKDFKDGINAVYEDALNEKINSGLDAKEAMKEIAQDYGLERSGLMGTTRTSDNVIIHKVNGKDVQFNVPTAVMEAIKGMNVEFAASIFKYPKMLNQWFGRALTQFYPMFAPKNLIMDVGERSEVIRVKDIYDAKGNKVDGNKVANSMLRKSFNPATIKNIAKEIISGKLESQDAKDLKELMDLGGASTFVQGLRDEKSLIDKINSHRNIAKNTKKKLLEVTEKYNDVFSYVPMLAAYQSFKENGVSPKDAASLTLDLTNFGKRGKWMSPVSALFVFAQPTALGAANLSRVLSTRRGQTRAAVYVAIGTALYMTLRALDDEDEGGNKLDQQGDITRNILIPSPINKGEYIKIPLGYGLPQWAWNISVNIARSLVGAQSGVDALSNIAVNNTKSFAPIAPSEIPVSKYPIEKAVMTLSPTLFQPFVQIALNKNAFGTAIKPAFARDDKLKSEQSKSTTAEEWKDAAIWLQRNTGVDMHPEQIKNLYDGYKGFLGPMRDLSTFLIENPNKEAQGKTTSNPILNSFYGSENAYAIQSRYYEAMDEAKQLKAELDSRKKQGDLGDWLTDDVKKKLAWYEQANKEEGKASAVKSKATKSNNKGGMSDAVYAGVVNSVAKSRADIQRRQLNQWRILNGQPTILTK